MAKLENDNPGSHYFFEKVADIFSVFIRLVLNILLIVLSAALLIGVFKAGYDVYASLNAPLSELLEKVLLDAVFIVAVLEIAITILGYLKDGQVHVRFIVDTILIIMLNEVIALWFTKPELNQMIGISVIILSLAAIRVSVTRFGPREEH